MEILVFVFIRWEPIIEKPQPLEKGISYQILCQRMELVSPAGNLEKLTYAYRFGADAVYIGVKQFSLRPQADNFSQGEWKDLQNIKGTKKLYGALNISFHNRDLARLEKEIEYLSLYPFDAFIISDMGVIPILQKRFPTIPLHLSTQANCTNWRAAEMYQDLGIRRVILGREVSLEEVGEIKSHVPDLEIEIFVHGALCLAYSGRCFLSAWMAERSANAGSCAHPCRWRYRVLEEEERPGQFYPILETEGFTTILSSKDLCMIDHVSAIQDARVDAIKIEGRMKSVYYTAVVTRAYRKRLDALKGIPVPHLEKYREDLFKVNHREYSTGFYFGKSSVETPSGVNLGDHHVFLGTIGAARGDGVFSLNLRNRIEADIPIEYIGPSFPSIRDENFILYSEDGSVLTSASHGQTVFLKPSQPVEPGYIIRKSEVASSHATQS